MGEFFNDFKKNISKNEKILLFSQFVKDPSKFGVIKSKSNGEIQDIVEKPKEFLSNEVLIGIFV